MREEIAGAAISPVRHDAAGFVLAGGQSSRMGQDKALLRFDGHTLVERALADFQQAGIPAAVVGQRASLAALADVVEDSVAGQGPLGGICAAMASMAARRAVFMPVDMPLLPPSALRFLADYAEIAERAVTLYSVKGWAQTFPAVLDREVLPALEARLQSGQRGCFSGFQAAAASLGQSVTILAVENIRQTGRAEHAQGLPASQWFLNVNTPAELCWAEKLAACRNLKSWQS